MQFLKVEDPRWGPDVMHRTPLASDTTANSIFLHKSLGYMNCFVLFSC